MIVLRFFYLFTGEWLNEKEKEMKVVAFNGSARKDGNTAILVNAVFKELKKQHIKTELVQLPGKRSGGVLPAENVLRIRINDARLRETLSMTVSKRCSKLTG